MPRTFPARLNAFNPLWLGVLFWGLFSLVGVAVQGVRWDENYEFAQVLNGQVTFPEGHPLQQYVWRLFSIQHFSLAALMQVLPGPLWSNAFRNSLFLMATTIPVYLWGATLARRPLVGHVAVVFVLLEIHVPFLSSYPIHVWPEVFSNGPVGLGYMLVAAWALATDRHRLAGGLIGFAPLVHLGQFPPLLAMTVLYLAWMLRQHRHAELKRLLLACLPGIAATIAFGLFLKFSLVAPPADGPYHTAAEPMRLWHHYMGHYATHRAIPYTIGHLVLAGAGLFGIQLLALRILRKRTDAPAPEVTDDGPIIWALVYMAISMGTVWAIMAIHRRMGADVPFLLLGWLPYRLMNHIGPLLIPLLLAVGVRLNKGAIPLWIPLLLLTALLGPLSQLVSVELATRYVTEGDYLFFLLFGVATGTLALQTGRLRSPWALRLSMVASVGLLACFHQFGAACAALGTIIGLLPTPGRLKARHISSLSVCLVAVLLLVLLAKHGERRRHLYIEPIFQHVTAYLEENGEGDAMLLVPYQQVGVQMKTGHPVMADMATQFIGIYVPPIAPAVNAIFQDFYGIYFDPDAPTPDAKLPWHGVWPAKSLEAWQRLSDEYDLRYVLAPSFMELPLEEIGRDSQNIFYRIPPSEQ